MITPPGAHGGDGPAIALSLGLDPDEIVDLSASLNPFAPDLTPLLSRHAAAIRHYPDPTGATQALAEAMAIDPARLLITNGGSEAISLVSAVLGGQVASEPEFSLHPRTGQGPLWRSDPQNPSGRLADATVIADVWDEAFYSLATGSWTAARSGVAVGSLTKLFACPGLRLGYVISDEVDRFSCLQPAWSVNSLGLAILVDVLTQTDLPGWAASLAEQRSKLAALLIDHGFEPAPSDAPWLLVAAPDLRARLAPYGVIVRDCSSFGLPSYARIAVPDNYGLSCLASALERSQR